ncbi:MAG: dockerin type I repeat-containing protein, partial [Candidatus Izemoplasmatales bacterium]|nr:dockerin type I repeat-containing protein [Candidatus Izemoplasmatales bacterium]
FNFVDANISVYPVYESRLKTFEVTFVNGDETIVQEVSYGYPATAPTPYKTGTDQITYSFVEWDQAFNSVISDMTVTAIFEPVYNYYVVEFYDGNNELFDIQHVTPGMSASTPIQEPLKDKTDNYVYIFNSWDKSYEDVDSDLKVYSIFIEVDRYYTVNFYNAINGIISTQTVEYGYDALEPEIPSKDMTSKYYYTFDHWSESFVAVSSNLDIYPIYTESVREFEVNFIDGDGVVIDTQMVEYGKSALAPDEAFKTHTDEIYYIFNGWDNTFSSITTDMDIHAVFTEVDRYYTVSFLDMYGNTINTQTIEYLKDAEDPIKEMPVIVIDGSYVNAVVGWDKTFSSITSDLVVNAVYEVKDRYYTVRFFDDLGGLLSSQTIEYGNSAIAPEIIAKDHPIEGYEYVLSGWSKDFEYVTSNLNIYPLFDSRIKTFTVTFINGDTITEEVVEYNQSATPPTPYKEGNDQVTYTFVAWDNDFRNVTEDITVKAIFNEDYSYYIVEFFNGNGTLISTQNVLPGTPATAPSVIPQKDSTLDKVYIFNSWNQEFDNVVSDMKIYGNYDEFDRYYTVNFYDSLNNVISTQTVEYGLSAIEPEIPVKAITEQYEYTFVAWTKMFNNVKEDLDIYPTYEESLREFEVEFIDGDGNVIDTQVVKYGENVVLPDMASKTHTDSIYYVFDGFNHTGKNIVQNTTITALFTGVQRYYTVTFYGQDNIVLNTQVVEYMSDAVDPVPSLPFEIVDENYVYAITGWDKDYKSVTQDLDIYAIYSTTARYLTVKFYDSYNVLISEQTVEYGHPAIAPIDQVKDSDEFYRYNFTGWDQDYSFVRTNMDIYPVFETEQIKFTVTFVNGDESVEQFVLLGEAAIAPTPYKSPTESSIFVFVEWDQDFSNITEDLVITAVFEEVFSFFTVTFYNGDGSVLEVQNVVPGGSATEPTVTPSKASTDTNSFVFSGWDKSFDNVSNNLDVYSLFDTVNLHYTVNFYDAYGVVISVQTVEYGTGAIAPAPPTKEMDSQYTYTFMKWSESFSNVKSDLDIYPVYTETTRPYEVVFYDGDGIIFDTQTVDYGQQAINPGNPSKSPNGDIYYVFSKWSQNFDFITGDLSVYPEFVEVDRYYDVVFYDDLGNVLDTQVVEYGKDASNPIPYLSFTIVDANSVYAIIGWDKSFTNVTTDLSITAIYGTIDRYYQVKFYDYDGSVLSEQTVEYGTSAIRPMDPVKPEDDAFVYGFLDWDKDYSFVRSNMDIYPIFEQTMAKYSVIFYDGDGNVYETQIVYQGQSAITPNGQPYKSPTPSSMFVFRGWDGSYENITQHTEVYPMYDELVRTFIVQFIDQFGQVLKEEFVQYSQSATAPTNFITPEPTDEYLYVPHWDMPYDNVTQDLQVKLYFEEMIRNYTYTFYDYDGSVIKTVTAEYGSTISLPIAPEKPMTEKYIYSFSEWGPNYNPILTENVEYYPYFDETIRTYEVKFIDGNGDLFATIHVPYGGNGVLPEGIPVKDETVQYYYEFTMWQMEPISVKRDMEIQALFNRYLQQYKVTFIDEFGNILKQQMVEYGTGATEPIDSLIPKKADTNMYTYTFAGWSRPFSNVTEDMTVQTVYIGLLRKYTYTFYDEDQETILKQVTDIYGTKILPPPAPTKEGDALVTYIFIGWDKVVSDTLTENITYYAIYEAQLKSYDVVFYNGNGQVLEVQKVYYGFGAITPSIIPVKASTTMYDYIFDEWQQDYSNITDNLNVFPVFTTSLRKYNVTFVYFDGTETTVQVEYGMSANGKVATPYQPGYRFIGWDKDISIIKQDTVVKALYEANDYEVRFHSVEPATGTMDTLIVTYNSEVQIPTNGFARTGYYFGGWKTDPDGEYPELLDQDSFTLDEEGKDLYATWIPIIYSIDYDLDGGVAVNPTQYTIEDRIVLQPAEKEDYKFLGWYVKEIIEDVPIDQLRGFKRYSSYETLQPIEVIEPGHIGNIVLVAAFQYDGYIKLKPESTLGLFHAEIATTIPIYEREVYDDQNPVYLLGVFLGQTIGNLKENFVNENIIFVDKDGNILTDDQVVATGYQIIIRDEEDETVIKDRVHIVLKGDVSGDGIINAVDTNGFRNHISNKVNLVEAAIILAADMNEDGIINAIDTNIIRNHINQTNPYWDPSQETTLEGDQI